MSKRGGQFDNAMFAAPWCEEMPDGSLGPTYLPLSPRTGRAVAQSTAHREYAESFHGVDSGGMWDHGEVAAGSSRPVAQPPRYDTERMAEFFRHHGSELTSHQWEIYTRFWVERRSYGAIARLLSSSRKNISNTVLTLRRKVATRVMGSHQHTGQVDCPKCKAKTGVSKTRHSAGVTRRDRRCLECGHRFRTVEQLETEGPA